MTRYRSPKSIFIQRMVLAALVLAAGLWMFFWRGWGLEGTMLVASGLVVAGGARTSWRLSPHG